MIFEALINNTQQPADLTLLWLSGGHLSLSKTFS
jgi:hypothetical protein